MRFRGLASGALLFAGLTAAARGGDPVPCGGFVGPQRVAMSREAQAIVAADFDGDGTPDVATVSGELVSVVFGTPEGFSLPVITATDNLDLRALVAGRFDADAPVDLMVASVNGGLQFMRGHGDGTFDQPVYVDGFDAFGGMAEGDVDGDGFLDVVGTNGEFVRVYLGQGDGTFDPPVLSHINSTNPNGIVLGLLNGDEFLDAVVSAYSEDTLIVLPGSGDGSFGTGQALVTGERRQGAILADFDGDGALDIADGRDFVEAEIWPGHGDGTFGARVPVPAPPVPNRFAAADLDGNGLPELLVVEDDFYSPGAGGIRVMRNQGNFSFASDNVYVSGAGGAHIATGDFNADGRIDVANAPGNVAEVWLLAGRGDGALHAIPYAIYGEPADQILGGDFNEDGLPDIAVGGYANNFGFTHVSVALALGGQAFTSPTLYPTSQFLFTASADDFNGDGHTDLVFLTGLNNTRSIGTLAGNGDGTFQPFAFQPFPGPTVGYYTALPGQFDGGGGIDLAVTTWDGTALSEIHILQNDGSGHFTSGPVTSIAGPGSAVAAADFDGDGALDLVVSTGPRLLVFPGHGDGTFGPPAPYDDVHSATAVVSVDINGDGHLDLVVAESNGTAVGVLPGDGHGSFGPVSWVGVGWIISSLAVEDFNGDGHLDVVTTGVFRATLILGYGDGTFTPPSTFVAGVFPFKLVAGDYDGDGLMDVAIADGYAFAGGASILWNSLVAGVTVAPSSAIVGSPATLVAAGGGLAAQGYQWRKGGVPLSDGGPISGATTATLTIDPVGFDDAGSYDVVVTDACGEVISNAVPLSVEFADVPDSSPFHDDIITIATEGITGGCGGGNYCPTSPVRRDQMAAFLLRSKNGSAYTPPACTDVFADVPCPSLFADWVVELAAQGITAGCDVGLYCPDQSVTRAQMAIFLLKTKNGSGYTPPPATGIFGDVPVGSFGAAFIEDLYNQGITGGCSTTPLLYCPGNPVLRQQMATLLVRTFFSP